MRIVAGSWAGAPLASPGGRVRPTTEEVRDAWLTLLEHELPGAHIVDLFAGSGALGLEALSRGARSCDFVESHPAALHALKANVVALRVRERTRIFKRDALDFASRARTDRYHIAFADPPYGSRQLDRLIEVWRADPFSRILTVEHATDHELPGRGRSWPFGETTISLYTQ